MCTMIGEFRLGNKAKLRKLRKSSKWSWLLSEEAQPFMSKYQVVLMGVEGSIGERHEGTDTLLCFNLATKCRMDLVEWRNHCGG